MTEKRTVECQDCGYRWESSAANPRCSKADCGRSRNVEPVDAVEDDDDADEPEPDEPADDDRDDEPEPEPDDETEPETPEDGEGDGYTPRFETRKNRAEDVADAADDPDGEVWTADEPEPEDEADAEEEDDEDVPELEPEDLEPMMAVAFDMAATRRGDHWELQEDEAERLSEAWVPVMNQYAPHVLREHYAITVAGMATVAVLRPRLKEDKRQQEKEEAKARDDASLTKPDADEEESDAIAVEATAETTDTTESYDNL